MCGSEELSKDENLEYAVILRFFVQEIFRKLVRPHENKTPATNAAFEPKFQIFKTKFDFFQMETMTSRFYQTQKHLSHLNVI